jgi:DUF1680 family protein
MRRRKPTRRQFLARTIAEAGGYAYGRVGDRVWVHFYGGNTVRTHLSGGWLGLAQETDYPWDSRITITLTEAPAREAAIRLRVPDWARDAALLVNGAAPPRRPEPDTYAEVRRAWSPGDLIELALPMPVRLMQAHPLVEEARNQVAVPRGPLVYCAESTDLPAGVSIQDITIPRRIDLKPRFDPALLGGVTVLVGRAEAWREPDWTGALYSEVARTPRGRSSCG